MKCLKLDLNESYHFLNDKIIEELKHFDRRTISTYPEYGPLTTEIAKYAGCRAEQIFLTNGSDQAIELLLRLFFKSGDEVAIPAPTFFVYFSILKLIGAKPKVLLYEAIGNTFKFPAEKTLKALTTKSKGLLLCNPSNPLGSLIAQEQIIRLLDKAKKLKIPVVIDEAYFEFSGQTSVKLLNKYPNLVIIRSFSKAFGVAGLRLGYVLANPEVIKRLAPLRLPWAINHFAVHAGKVVLRHQKYFRGKINEVLETKKKLAQSFREQGIICYDTATNFLTIKVPKAKELVGKFRSAGIIVNEISHYPYADPLLKNGLRLTVPAASDLDYLLKVCYGYKNHESYSNPERYS